MDKEYDRESRRRSRSPRAGSYRSRHRDRSPRPRARRNDHSQKHSPPTTLPFDARRLSKHDFDGYKALFATYLDIQKGLILTDLDKSEARGRWKSFMGKWNRGELAEGWYDPTTAAKSIAALPPKSPPRRRESPSYGNESLRRAPSPLSSDDEGPGPSLPNKLNSRSGPTIPTFQDLVLKREQAAEDVAQTRSHLRALHKASSKETQSRLEDLAPRAEPGTRERQLEKKRELATANRAFAATKGGGDGMAEVAEGDLMGGEDGG